MQTILKHLSFQDYLKIDAINSTKLKTIIQKSIKDLELPDKDSADKLLGRAFHCLALTPNRFYDDFAVSPKFDRRTKAGKQDAAEFEAMVSKEGKEALTPDQLATAEDMVDALAHNKLAQNLLENALCEITLIWNEPIIDKQDPMLCKARLDAFCENAQMIVDLKKIGSAQPANIVRTIGKFGYHIQDYWYRNAVSAIITQNVDMTFCFVQDSPPYHVVWYEIGPETREVANRQILDALVKFAECKYNNAPTGYSAESQIETIEIPNYLL